MGNIMLLDQAAALLPQLHETTVEVARTVALNMDKNRRVQIEAAEDYRKKRMKKGDELIIDFGDHQVGYLNLKLDYEGSHPDAPVLMRIHFAENPVELFENAESYQGWICSSWIEEEQIHIDVIPTNLQLARRYAFRYVKIQILDISSKFSLVVRNAVCTAVSSANDKELQSFEFDKELHKRLDEIACRTLHNCMQTVFEDGPKRDRRLWMGDLRMQALANYQTYQKNDMVKACLYLFAALPLENGQVGACLFLEPSMEVDDTAMFDYSLLFIACLRDYYMETKDLEALNNLWTTALSQIYIAEEKMGDAGVIEDSDELGWCFVDWNLELNKQASAHGIFMYALKAAIELAGVLGEQEEKKKLVDIYDNAKQDALNVLWDEEKQCFVSGKGKQVSIASQVWMILGGAVTGQKAVNLLKRMETMEDVVGMVTPYMYHNYIDALMQLGQREQALEKLETYWGGMADQGADTFWELYNPQNPNESPYGGTIVNSYCHAWSCAPAYFLRKYFGKKRN